jgi:hypothetical protein
LALHFIEDNYDDFELIEDHLAFYNEAGLVLKHVEKQMRLGPTRFVTKTKAFSEQMAELIRELIGTE